VFSYGQAVFGVRIIDMQARNILDRQYLGGECVESEGIVGWITCCCPAVDVAVYERILRHGRGRDA
jgi:hypothetical protein